MRDRDGEKGESAEADFFECPLLQVELVATIDVLFVSYRGGSRAPS